MGTDLLSDDGRHEERVRQPYCQQVHFLRVVNLFPEVKRIEDNTTKHFCAVITLLLYIT